MRKPYLIRAPNFDATSGGIRVMYALYGWLLAKGEIAFMNTPLKVPTVGIYPEVYAGNELGATKIVRYLLNKPGVMGRGTPGTSSFRPGPTTFDPSDKIYIFSRIFDTIGVDDDHIMFLPVLNLKIFKNQKCPRSKTCFLPNRYHKSSVMHPDDSIELVRKFAQDQQALADLMNECYVMYCYDDLSAMTEVARLCGCEVRYFGNHSEEDLEKYEPGLNGFSTMGNDRKLDTEAFRSHYIDLGRLFLEKLDKFIEETQRET